VHQIKGNKSTRTPGQHIVVQVVTNNHPIDKAGMGLTKVFAGVVTRRFRPGASDSLREKQEHFTDVGSFWGALFCWLNPKIGTWVWCDNLVDHLELLSATAMFTSGRLGKRRCVFTSKSSYVRCETDRGHVTFLDRSNWWRSTISEMIDATIADGEMPINCLRAEERATCSADTIVAALSHHVKKLCRFVMDNDLGVMQLTAPAQSFAAYRHRFAPKRSFQYTPKTGKNRGITRTETRCWPDLHDNQEVKQLEQAAFHGGDTRVFFVGRVDNPVHVLDVRSMYPFCMFTCEFPVKLAAYDQPSTRDYDAIANDLYDCIADVTINSRNNQYPYRRKNDTIYPLGYYRTVLAGPELVYAARAGDVNSIHYLAKYDMMPIFTNFVTDFNNLRTHHESIKDHVAADLCKLVMNSLWAKFAQRTGEWTDCESIPPEMPWGYWHGFNPENFDHVLCRSIGWHTQILTSPNLAPHAFVAIPAFVCSYGRIYRDLLIRCAQSGGQVYYSAVDSIHCDGAAARILTTAGHVGDKIGQLRLKMLAMAAEYRGIGDYTLDGKATRSGIPTSSVPFCGVCQVDLVDEHLNCSRCGRPWDGRTYSVVTREFPGEMIATGRSGEALNRKMIIRRDSGYNCGRVLDSGWVEPYTIGMENEAKENESGPRQNE